MVLSLLLQMAQNKCENVLALVTRLARRSSLTLVAFAKIYALLAGDIQDIYMPNALYTDEKGYIQFV